MIDTGLVLQLNEQEDNHNGTSRYQEQQGWVDGRLARKRVIASMEQQKKKVSKANFLYCIKILYHV